MKGAMGAIVACAAAALGCGVDLGTCDEEEARRVVYTDDAVGLPAYTGQALIDASCGNGGFCHAEDASDRYGASAGQDFDVRLATDTDDTARLRRAWYNVATWRKGIFRQVDKGFMPPGNVGQDIRAVGPVYRDLPEIHTAEGQAILKNWLACGAPLVERTEDDRPAGVEPVGDIVAAQPTIDPTMCTETVCGNACVNTNSDPLHCGACDRPCATGEVCFDGSCLSGGCPGNTTQCGQACVDTSGDPLHCGGCDVVCDGNETCADSQCVCNTGLALCVGECVDLNTEPNHCGTCGRACVAGELCEAGICSMCGDGISFAADVQPIFTATCTGSMCHSGRRPAGELSLEAGQALSSLQQDDAACGGREHLVPGDAGSSYLVEKVKDPRPCRGSQMPKAEMPLEPAQIAIIEEWICAGAPDN